MKTLDNMTELELRELMNGIAKLVQGALPPGTGFIVLAAPFGGPGTAQYCANGQRDDCVRWLKETANRLEGREDKVSERHRTCPECGNRTSFSVDAGGYYCLHCRRVF